MSDSIDLRTRALRRAVERYERACRNWKLNPTPATESERIKALLAVLDAREKPN